MGPVTTVSVFSARRKALGQILKKKGFPYASALTSGWARPRNFAHNHFPFRAESHFLYLVGRHLEGAVLLLSPEGEGVVYMNPPDDELALWTGPAPSLDQLQEDLGILVRPLTEFPEGQYAALPPQDEASAAWLSELLDRDVEAQSGPELQGADAALADAMVLARLRKDAAAVTQMQYAADITALAHQEAMRCTPLSNHEAVVRARLESVFTAHGLVGAYNSILTQAGEVLHQERSDQALVPGGLLLCDAGAESAEGWAADVTRTWPTSGTFSPLQRDVYSLVLAVQEAAIAGATVGASFKELHLSAQRQLTTGLFDLGLLRGSRQTCDELRVGRVFFPHGLGHLLGLDVHDMEDLGDRAGYPPGHVRDKRADLRFLRLDRPLAENMVVTIEPGFYQIPQVLAEARKHPELCGCIDWDKLAEWKAVRGIRIEDDVLITNEGPCVLSAGAPKTPAVLEELMTS